MRQLRIYLSMEPIPPSKVKHLYVYSLSPNRQKAMAGLGDYIRLWIRSSLSLKTFVFLPALASAGYLVYWAQEDYIKRNRKGYGEHLND